MQRKNYPNRSTIGMIFFFSNFFLHFLRMYCNTFYAHSFFGKYFQSNPPYWYGDRLGRLGRLAYLLCYSEQTGVLQKPSLNWLHTEKSFLNLVKLSRRNQIVFIISRLIWIQMKVRLDTNQSENGKYNLILIQ